MKIVEARIPTYKRPELLKRALESLIQQTYTNWIALVFDDSPLNEAKEVLESFNDERLRYKPNKKNLGRAGNIDIAFKSGPYCNGRYAFVLEDDNYLFPGFIESNIDLLKKQDVNILMRNQVVRIEKDGKSVDTEYTTRGKWFNQGLYTPIELYSYLFFHTGISNGGLFWDTENIKSDLQVGSLVQHSSQQEMFRSLKVKENIYFDPEPLCVFTFFDNRKDINGFSKIDSTYWNRGQQSIYIYLISKYGEKLIDLSKNLAKENDLQIRFEEILLDALYTEYNYQYYYGLKYYYRLL